MNREPAPIPNASPVHVPFGTAHEWNVLGDRTRLLVGRAQSGGRFSLFETVTPPGLGPPMHVHTREDETFRILEGRYEFVVGDQRLIAGPGDTLFAPRDVPHRFGAIGGVPGRMLIFITPSGIEDFFDAVHREIGDRLPPDEAVLSALLDRAGIRLV
ncbi:MAG: cupin domain-containing protein [Phycisphaerae bacterium]|nr:cupin domain-containing protein [Phycisphaerae bacterium]